MASARAAATPVHDGPHEVDTCRICRGEGSLDEPLFHPCKCSGSIMYVHQDCLMEWLSHSQKKHCELCKTSFTFTKLYHPAMPTSLPTGIFIRKAAGHVVSRLLYWTRATIVALTWLFWLPWTMRFVWWGLFWLADMGWVHDVEFQDGGLVQTNLTRLVINATADRQPPARDAVRGPALFRLFVWFFTMTLYGDWDGGAQNDTLAAVGNASTELVKVRSRDTLLSEVPFFKHPVLDRVTTDVLEGLIITISLVAAIVLLLLIREWVVQQQPIINMGADDNAPQPAAHQVDPDPNVDLNDTEDAPSDTPDVAPNDSGEAQVPQRTAEEPPLIPDLRVEVDPSLAELANVQALARELGAAQAQLRDFRRGDLQDLQTWDPDSRSKHEMAVLVVRLHETHLALARGAHQALEQGNIDSVRELLANFHILETCLGFLSESEAQQLRVSMQTTIHQMEQFLDSSDGNHEDTENARPLASIQAASEEPSEATGQATTSNKAVTHPRPTMPGRDESFRATEIQRHLQESISAHQAEVQEGRSMAGPGDIGSRGSNSDGSWQEIDRFDDGPETSGGARPSSDGLEPISTDSITGSVPAEHIRRNSLPSPLGTGSGGVNFDRTPPRTEFWPRKTRPSAGGRRSTDLSVPTSERSSLDDGVAGNLAGTRSDDASMLARKSESAGDDGRPEGEAQGRDSSEPEMHSSPENHTTRDLHRPPETWFGKAGDWLWGDINPPQEDLHVHDNDEHVIEDIEDEEPFIPVVLGQAEVEGQQNRQAQNARADADRDQALGRPALVPNEAELAEEAEELEGVLELIGMQGPITGLFTNALFAAVFVSCTTTSAIWLPFLVGKVVLVWVAHPISLGDITFRAASSAVNIFIDVCVFGLAYAAQWVLDVPLNWISAWKGFTNKRYETPFFGPLAMWSIDLLNQSYSRLAGEVLGAVHTTGTASSQITLDSHEALTHIKSHVSGAFNGTTLTAVWLRQQLSIKHGGFSLSASSVVAALGRGTGLLKGFSSHVVDLIRQLSRFLVAGQVTFTHKMGSAEVEAPSEFPVWTALDRSLTVSIGYAGLAIIAAIYFSKLAPIATSREGRRIENMILEVLQQAGGISKVILIISIEMLAFPLYCGLLLDFAMLPLFGSASIESRLKFTVGSPWTSVFVHWFIGTCYMFHFALFVAMCRKILRKGVLYFIRDPDDPTFHPVRDVLERSVVSQLRKIASSALIYGGLVIVCLGSVLWLLAYGISGILPIKWTSDSSFLGFPVDLLLYTTLKPLLVRFFAPSDWLHRAYAWWFRRSARALRLSHYLFGEDNQDERGLRPIYAGDGTVEKVEGNMTGRWVRVPNNDQVRVGKGRQAWTDVDENNHRQDGVTEPDDVQGVGPNDTNFTKVFIPPNFRLRITLFIASLWALTAGAGFALTVLPLVCGRSLFALMLPRTLWANDIYAFSIGLVTICAVAFMVVQSREATRGTSVSTITGLGQATASVYREYGATLSNRTRQVLRCVYVYGSLSILLPCIFALFTEFYLLAPLHTWLTEGKEAHTIQMLRSWTLGVQYVRILVTVVQWHQNSRPARAFRAVTARGYSNPDAGKATRYFFLPLIVASGVALLLPMPLGMVAAWAVSEPGDEAKRRLVSCMAFPAILAVGVAIFFLHWAAGLVHSWRMRIRDEVYLIGERLHNYGERSAPALKSS